MTNDFQMDKQKILTYLAEADSELRAMERHLTIYVSGGANICFYCGGRETTHDIDTFPSDEALLLTLRERLAVKFSLPITWINPSASIFIKPPMMQRAKLVMNFNNLKVYF
jgi:hypothetical protein